jgi:hypothetical protein
LSKFSTQKVFLKTMAGEILKSQAKTPTNGWFQMGFGT